ncbi:MAG TPA: hypothetical protein VFZ64_08830 [Nocardioidaceae bacterium]
MDRRDATTGPRVVGLVLAAALLAAGCESGSTREAAGTQGPSPSPSVRTLEPLPPPPSRPPTGRLYADLRQSSRDAALGRIQVWLRNDTVRDLEPTRITYRDPRFRAPVPGERLRTDPARSERGYPLVLPGRPRCGPPRRGRATLVVAHGGEEARVRVEDPTDVVGRYVASRCLELAVAQVAAVRFADRVGTSQDGTGFLTLLVDPRPPRADVGSDLPRRLAVESVSGTPVLAAAGRPVWTPQVSVRRGGPTRRVRLPVVPARCDPHAFMESGGATAFRVKVRLDGRPGELVVRMSPAGAAAALDHALDVCGLG